MSEVYSRRYGHHFDYYLTDADRDAVVNEIINHFSKENKMHYRNGREAKNGDKIVMLGGSSGAIEAFGILHSAVAGNDYCNGNIAVVQGANEYACMCDCLHVDDLAEVLKAAGLDKRPVGM